MSLDRWFPTRFSVLSDRLVIQNGILIMGGLALVIMLFTRGSVRLLVVLYSINVFITFAFPNWVWFAIGGSTATRQDHGS
jgi:hypothetical protein